MNPTKLFIFLLFLGATELVAEPTTATVALVTSRAPRPPIDTGDSASTGPVGTQFTITTPCACGTGGGGSSAIDAYVNGGNSFSTAQAILGTTNNLDLVIRTGSGSMPAQGRLAIRNTGETQILAGNPIQFYNPTNSACNTIQARASLAVSTAPLLFPVTDATVGQVLANDGTGNMYWATVGGGDSFTNGGNAFGTPEAVLGTTNGLDLYVRAGSGSLATDTRLVVAGTGPITVKNGGELRFEKTGDPTKWSGFTANPLTTISNSWVLPPDNGTYNQVLATDGAGTVFWSNRGTVNTNKACAYLGSDVAVTSPQTLVFDQISFNPGANYNNTTGVYTAPSTGVYLVTTQACVQLGNSGTKKINIFKGYPGGTAIPGCTGKIVVPTFSFSTTNIDTYTIPLSTMVSLAAGDTIYIVYTGDNADTIIADGTELAVHVISQ